MPVPLFENFVYPFLLELKDKEKTTKEMKEALIKHFNLSDEDCALRTKGGTTTQISDRINWTRQYLRRALFIDIPKRGVYHITQRGKEYLKKNNSLCKKDLMKYHEFSDFANASSDTETSPTLPFDNPNQTPTEMLEQAYNSIINDLIAELLQKTLDQTPKFFEFLVVDLMVKMGYGGSFENSAEVTQYIHDDGIDGIIYEDKLGLDKIYIQAKRYKPDNVIGKPQIQQFAGALEGKKAHKGVFITTSSYSNEARKYVGDLSNKKIVLIDGSELARYMIEYNVGVSTKHIYEIKRIDSDYFEE